MHLDYKREIVKTSLPTPPCFYQGCSDETVYEGWMRVSPTRYDAPRDAWVSVCEEHKMSLIGFQEGKEPDNVTASH